MVKIRLRRVGAKKQPVYRIMVADVESPQRGAFLENIGQYNPRTEPETLIVDEERALYWLGQGAQPSERVAAMLKKLGIMDKYQSQKASARAGEQTASGG